MTITEEEARKLQGMAGASVSAMEEGGASACLVLWTRKVGTEWRLEWARSGSPYECVHLAHRYGVIDSQQALAGAIAAEINKPDDGDNWKDLKS